MIRHLISAKTQTNNDLKLADIALKALLPFLLFSTYLLVISVRRAVNSLQLWQCTPINESNFLTAKIILISGISLLLVTVTTYKIIELLEVKNNQSKIASLVSHLGITLIFASYTSFLIFNYHFDDLCYDPEGILQRRMSFVDDIIRLSNFAFGASGAILVFSNRRLNIIFSLFGVISSMTLYSGILLSDNFNPFAINLGFGIFSVDVNSIFALVFFVFTLLLALFLAKDRREILTFRNFPDKSVSSQDSISESKKSMTPNIAKLMIIIPPLVLVYFAISTLLIDRYFHNFSFINNRYLIPAQLVGFLILTIIYVVYIFRKDSNLFQNQLVSLHISYATLLVYCLISAFISIPFLLDSFR